MRTGFPSVRRRGGGTNSCARNLMKGFYAKITLIPKKRILPSTKYFCQEPYEGILRQNFLNSRKLFYLGKKSFRQEPYEGILCQNYFNSKKKRILPSIKHFSQEPYEGILCQNFLNSRKLILLRKKIFQAETLCSICP